MLPLVILVWSFVFYQLFGSFFTTPIYAKEEFKPIVNIAEIKKDTFFIVADYRDPFLGKKRKRKSQKFGVAGKKRIGTKKTPKTEKPWPGIIYKGMIKNNSSDRRVGILSVGGREYLIKEKEIVAEVTILSINKHRVSLRFQKEKKTITK